MVRSRTLTAHTSNEEIAEQVMNDILNRYFAEFLRLQQTMGRPESKGSMSSRFGLKERVIERICVVLAKYPQVRRAILYGSRAKGTFKEGSDIDLTLPVLYRIADELDYLLLPYTFDLSILNCDPEVLEHIQRVGVTFYERSTTL